jgi:hypothetical protein
LSSPSRFTPIQVKLSAENDQQFATHAVTALRQGMFSKFPEIVAFGKKLSHSFQAAQVSFLQLSFRHVFHKQRTGSSPLRMEHFHRKMWRQCIGCRFPRCYGNQRGRCFVSRDFKR